MTLIKSFEHAGHTYEIWMMGTGTQYVRQIGYKLWTKI